MQTSFQHAAPNACPLAVWHFLLPHRRRSKWVVQCLFFQGGPIFTTHFFISSQTERVYTRFSGGPFYLVIFFFSASPPSSRKNKLLLGGYLSAQNLVIYLCAWIPHARRRAACFVCFNFISGIVRDAFAANGFGWFSRSHKLALVPAPRSSHTPTRRGK